MPTTLNYTGQLVVEECHCGIKHAIPAQLQQQARDHGKTVYCPLGHSWVYTDTTDKKLRRERERREAAERRAQASRDLLRHEERSHAATRGHLTRSKRRAAAGTCPCCNRTFEQLSRHMKNQHPEFVAAAALTV
jgi:hypothetical protein